MARVIFLTQPNDLDCSMKSLILTPEKLLKKTWYIVGLPPPSMIMTKHGQRALPFHDFRNNHDQSRLVSAVHVNELIAVYVPTTSTQALLSQLIGLQMINCLTI